MKINVHAGHTSQNGKACGACGIVKESVEDRKIKDKVIKLLKSRGHTVYDCTSEGSSASDNLYQIVKKCNAHDVDLDVSIHLNCYNGKGHGTETLIYSDSSKAKATAKRIDKNLSALGFTDRGIKIINGLYVLRRTNAPALLIETFFCDNKTDCDLYKKLGVDKIATAIADGITTKTETKAEPKKQEPKKTTKKTNEQIAKEVIAGKWGNGEVRRKKLTAAGYNYSAIQRLVNKMVG
jgi:N-acetylmuramoyl-L-alanine amidase